MTFGNGSINGEVFNGLTIDGGATVLFVLMMPPGTRLDVPQEGWGMRVEGDNRRFIVEPGPDELVEQKRRELV